MKLYQKIKYGSPLKEAPSFSNPEEFQASFTTPSGKKKKRRTNSLQLLQSTQRLYNQQVINH